MSKFAKFIIFTAGLGLYWYFLYKISFSGELSLMAALSFMGPVGLYAPLFILLLFLAPIFALIIVQTVISFSKPIDKDKV